MAVIDTLLSVVLVGGALFIAGPALMGMVNTLQQQVAAGATPPATVPGTTTTTPPATTGNPLQDMINQIIAQLQGATGGTTTTPTQPPAGSTPGQVYIDPSGNPIFLPSPGTTVGADPSLCKSKYFGKCDTECKNGNNSNCQACKVACGLTSNFAMAYNAVYNSDNMPLPIGYKMTLS
jgi:hypothetical protein